MKLTKALKDVKRLAFDTMPIIYFIEQNPNYFNRMMAIMQYAKNENIRGVSSFLTLAEVLVHPLKTGNQTLAQEYEDILINSADFQLIPIADAIARKTAALRSTYNLKTPDALHVASAIESKCDAFLTNDKGLKRVSEIQILILDDLELDKP